jgi:AcrR family transcriptional regulator
VARTQTPLTRERIVDTAVALADADGLAGLSMRALARELGVEAMSLYHHVPNKDALLDAMVDVVFAEFHDPVPGAAWREELRRRSLTGREAMKRHRWAIGLMDSRTSPAQHALHHHDAVLGCLRESGFPITLVATAFALLDAHLYGFVVQELALPFQGESELAEVVGDVLTAIPAGQLEHFTWFAREHALQPGYDFGDEFEVGLDLILDGLAARLPASG